MVLISTSLPIIDISPFLSNKASPALRSECASRLSSACRDVGFFYLVGHSIPSSTTDSILSLSRKFFLETPDSGKAQIQRRQPNDDYGDGARGYQCLGENVSAGKRDFQEAIDFYREEAECLQQGPPYELLKGRNLWPESPRELETALKDYVEQIKVVATAVVRAMGTALDLGEYEEVFVEATRKSFWVMRMIGYPPLPKTNGEAHLDGSIDSDQSCGAHTDYGCVTLLLADDTKGALQVRAKDGTWINADPISGAFVVNIGDMMERWTNGLWRSTEHRVIHRGDNYRVSVPFFFEPNWDAKAAPLQKCVERTGGKKKYDEVCFGDHLTAKVRGNFY